MQVEGTPLNVLGEGSARGFLSVGDECQAQVLPEEGPAFRVGASLTLPPRDF